MEPSGEAAWSTRARCAVPYRRKLLLDNGLAEASTIKGIEKVGRSWQCGNAACRADEPFLPGYITHSRPPTAPRTHHLSPDFVCALPSSHALPMQEVKAEIDAAIAASKTAPHPEPQALWTNIYKGEQAREQPLRVAARFGGVLPRPAPPALPCQQCTSMYPAGAAQHLPLPRFLPALLQPRWACSCVASTAPTWRRWRPEARPR
jgi:hypothetical protein